MRCQGVGNRRAVDGAPRRPHPPPRRYARPSGLAPPRWALTTKTLAPKNVPAQPRALVEDKVHLTNLCARGGLTEKLVNVPHVSIESFSSADPPRRHYDNPRAMCHTLRFPKLHTKAVGTSLRNEALRDYT